MKHLLLIDDDMFIRDLVATKLTSQGYSIATASNAEEGLAALAASKPDLVLLDLELPDMHGLEVLKKIKTGAETSSVPVVIFSNNDDDEIRKQLESNGASAFFSKVSMNMSELHQELNSFL